jgi:hypothetical protein
MGKAPPRMAALYQIFGDYATGSKMNYFGRSLQ